MKKMINHILTGADNQTFDNGRVMCFLMFMGYLILAFWNQIDHKAWSSIEYATGATAMAVGFGINLKLKRKTEPKPKK